MVDLEQLVAGGNELLQRTLGEDVDVETVSETGLWKCRVDPAQLQNVILNLSLNSRDAMPGGGRLTIETRNARLDRDYASQYDEVEAGEYVCLSVSDKRTGMSSDVLEKVFDPFFTTKEPGQGTGLGMSMVYGFVKQSGGHVRIYSEPDHGTTVKIFLPPAIDADADPVVDPTPLADVIPMGEGERILVVEDDQRVRELTVRMLDQLGYTTLDADRASAALEILAAGSEVDLLFTDVVLPDGVGGVELAQQAQELRPDLPVLFDSGYPALASMREGRLDPGDDLLEKPFSKSELAQKVRAALSKETEG